VSYFYCVYGLRIESSSTIAGLQALLTTPGTIDVCFEDGPEPDWARRLLALPGQVLTYRPEPSEAADPTFTLTQHGAAEGYELAYTDGTRFVVDSHAKRVWGTYQAPLTADDLASYFLGPVAGFLLRRRYVTCLHSSAVEIRGHAVCFCGEAGAGKSTTAAALGLRGLPVLAEDVVALAETGRNFQALPGYPRVCLWPQSVQMLLGSEDALPQWTPVWEKCYLPLDGRRASFVQEKLPVGMVYIFAPRREEASAPRIEPLSRREALLELVRNTYMNWVIDREQRAVEFDTLCRLVQQVAVRRIVPHALPEKIADLCELIVKDAPVFFSTTTNSPAAIPR
jgi:hypothetical protein